jgi:hypothetical protein
MESKLKIKLKSSSKIVTFEHVILLNRSIGKGEGRREKGEGRLKWNAKFRN